MGKKNSTTHMTGTTDTCEFCGDKPVKIKLVAYGSKGEELDSMDICVDCIEETISELLPGCEDARDGEKE